MIPKECLNGHLLLYPANNPTQCAVATCPYAMFDPPQPPAPQPADSGETEIIDWLQRVIDDARTPDVLFNCKSLYYLQLEPLLKSRIAAAVQAERQTFTKHVDRFEVIDDSGRAYVKGSIYGSPVQVELLLQDNGRTLKAIVAAAKLDSEQQKLGGK